jgi:hypothetical protein
MTSSMTIGPSVKIGGNDVQVTTKGKIQVTNPKGKVVTLTQDQFRKQTFKNIDKIQNGEDFEYKKNHKGLKIAGATIGTIAVVTGAIYHKEIGKYMKDFSFSKLWNDIKDLFKPVKKDNPVEKLTNTIFSGEKAITYDASDAKVARETLALKEKTIADMTHYNVNEFDKMIARTKGAKHNKKQEMYEKLFANKK